MTGKIFSPLKKPDGRVLILEDDAVMGEWLGSGLSRQGMDAEWTNNYDSAKSRVGSTTLPPVHAVVTDVYIQKDEKEGLQLLDECLKIDIPVFIITSRADLEIAKEAINRGACGLLEKPFEIVALVNQIQAVWQEPKFLVSMLERWMELNRLTSKEQEVCRLVVKGLSNKEIGSALEVTEKTVKFHITSIFDKFGVKSRSELVSCIYST
ncbi:MAG: hypothetical protein COV44_00350 [Deltaproteobacteria bacterium CG11_big_fil_rev_8_21_14_0_20_45_16]|nr:MAG: hypothetical protein COV44_00350 [Deltaproteobacteria bacterium CG11_big_fil_rev_8_21_14_0_20_45_16]